MYLNNFILGVAEDVTGYFVYTKFYDLFNFNVLRMYGYPHGIPHSILSYSEPGVVSILFILARYFDPIIVFNILVVVMACVVCFSAFKLFSLFTKNRLLSFTFAFVFIASPYFIYHIRSHPQLVQLWAPILYLYVLLFNRINPEHKFNSRFMLAVEKYRSLFLGLLLAVTILFSNYLGFFIIIFIPIFYLPLIFLNRKSRAEWMLLAKEVLVQVILGGILSLFWFIPFYLNQHSAIGAGANSPFTRTLDDFVTFSSRPWYYLLPSTDNPFLGNFTQATLNILQNDWGYYLTQNYYKDEHSASFIGYTSIILSLVGLYRLKVQWNKQLSVSRLLLSLYIAEIVLVVFSMPPYFTFAGNKILLPSYLLYILFPMFRALARVGVLVFLINAIFAIWGLSFVLEKIKKPFFQKLIIITVSTLFFCEVFVPIKISLIEPVPEFVLYLKSIDDAPIVVYPYKYTSFMFFWMKDYAKPLINPRDFKYDGFDSKVFTTDLNTCDGLQKAKSLGAKYLIEVETNKEAFFKDSGKLHLLKQFDATDDFSETNSNLFLTVVDLRAHPSVNIYEISEDIKCE